MDVNGHRFHLLFGERDWLIEAPTAESVGWSEHDQTVALEPERFLFRVYGDGESGPALAPPQRRGAAIDRYRNRYWISEDRRTICTATPDARAGSHYWRPGDGEQAEPPATAGAFAAHAPGAPPPALTLRGLTVTADHYLVVGVVEPASAAGWEKGQVENQVGIVRERWRVFEAERPSLVPYAGCFDGFHAVAGRGIEDLFGRVRQQQVFGRGRTPSAGRWRSRPMPTASSSVRTA